MLPIHISRDFLYWCCGVDDCVAAMTAGAVLTGAVGTVGVAVVKLILLLTSSEQSLSELLSSELWQCRPGRRAVLHRVAIGDVAVVGWQYCCGRTAVLHGVTFGDCVAFGSVAVGGVAVGGGVKLPRCRGCR